METSTLATNPVMEVGFLNHFPARGWKRFRSSSASCSSRVFLNHFPARGWKRQISIICLRESFFLNHFPARGWKRERTVWGRLRRPVTFLNHFPARGWKPWDDVIHIGWLLFKSFPRKGMETSMLDFVERSTSVLLFKSFPRKGMETRNFQLSESYSKYPF